MNCVVVHAKHGGIGRELEAPNLLRGACERRDRVAQRKERARGRELDGNAAVDGLGALAEDPRPVSGARLGGLAVELFTLFKDKL